MYNRLNLNRNLLINDIKNYLDLNKVVSKELQLLLFKDNRYRVEIIMSGGIIKLDFLYMEDGTTTIDIYGGNDKQQSIKEDIAKFIVTKGKSIVGGKVNKFKSQFIMDDVREEDLKYILELLNNEGLILNINKKNTISTMYLLKGSQDDQVIINHFIDGKLIVEGKQLMLYNELQSYLITLLECNDITSLFNNIYDVELHSKSETEILLQYIPCTAEHLNFYPFNKLLIQSIYNLHTSDNLQTVCYDGYIVPATKAFEGFLKNVLYNDYKLTVSRNSLPEFSFNSQLERYVLTDYESYKIKNPEVLDYINRCYNYYRDSRHNILHYSSPSELNNRGEHTKILRTKTEADDIIEEILKRIEYYYKNLFKYSQL